MGSNFEISHQPPSSIDKGQDMKSDPSRAWFEVLCTTSTAKEQREPQGLGGSMPLLWQNLGSQPEATCCEASTPLKCAVELWIILHEHFLVLICVRNPERFEQIRVYPKNTPEKPWFHWKSMQLTTPRNTSKRSSAACLAELWTLEKTQHFVDKGIVKA